MIHNLLLILSISCLIQINYSLRLGSNAENEVPGRVALDNFPLIDGHNDLPYNLYEKIQNKIEKFDFKNGTITSPIFGPAACRTCHTDLPRLKEGKIGAQFWVAYVNCKKENSVARTLEQIDVIKRLVQMYPDDLELVTTANGILEAFNHKKIASLIGVEGGHSIGNSLAVLRMFYELGARYLTLTHTCNLEWADSATVDQNSMAIKNLTEFGKKIIWEMNRLGMLVDLSHVSNNVMLEAIEASKAPIIFSHSSAKAVYSHVRNVDDKVLKQVKKNKGVVMVNFYSHFVAKENATIEDVINHINHIVDVIGVNHVGIGGDFDGIEKTPIGLEDVSKYPDLFDRLKVQNPNRWTIENLEKLAGRNFIRVFKQVEKVKNDLKEEIPDDDIIESQ